jgi:hypothetical protein
VLGAARMGAQEANHGLAKELVGNDRDESYPVNLMDDVWQMDEDQELNRVVASS